MVNQYAVGSLVYLRSPTEQDARGRWHEWLSDESVTTWLASQRWPNSVESQLEFLRSTQNESRKRMVLSIVERATDRHIGVCNLSGIDWVHRFADIAVVIGESEFRTGLYATQVVALLLNVAFGRLNLRIVKGAYLASNPETEAILKLFRFKEVGRYHDLFWHRDGYVDGVVAMLSRTEWLARQRSSKHSSAD